ncbi:mechanosensitive ion channel family protein [Neolewinella persica]|uniref:mechanosensitive ion channel family protein n=1 Tax=Neolewinella persica TaxID=70998 RepID=UPI0003A4F17E|nr:mechanosensitive ion channel domain-containing protein [Neolewinella persica]
MKQRNRMLALLVTLLEVAAFVIGVFLLFRKVLQVDESLISAHSLRTIISAMVFLTAINLLAKLIKWWYRQRGFARRRGVKNFVFGVENIRKLLLIGLFLFTFSSLMGVDPIQLLTSLSIVAAAIAIISKEFVNDLIVGMYYSFSDVFEAGDYVKFHGYKGRVVDIGLLKVKIMNDNDDLVILPNGKVYSEEIINYTRRDVRLMSIDFEIDIKMVKDIDSLELELIQAVADYAEYIEPDSYNLKILEVRKDLLELKFQYQLIGGKSTFQREIKRKTVRAVFSYVTLQQELVLPTSPAPAAAPEK